MAAAESCLTRPLWWGQHQRLLIHTGARRMTTVIINLFLNRDIFSDMKVSGDILKQFCLIDRKRGTLFEKEE